MDILEERKESLAIRWLSRLLVWVVALFVPPVAYIGRVGLFMMVVLTGLWLSAVGLFFFVFVGPALLMHGLLFLGAIVLALRDHR